MTNAHAIVPGMLPNAAARGSNTAWQVGLAAGLAATANLRPPNAALSHQAATTAAAARAAAAFQASRALTMAKSQSQQSPLLQQGSIAAGELSNAITRANSHVDNHTQCNLDAFCLVCNLHWILAACLYGLLSVQNQHVRRGHSHLTSYTL